MWTFEHSETTTAPKEQVWQHYADPSRWPSWDHATAEVTPGGPMTEGATARLRPTRGPTAKITFVEVDPPWAFTTVARLPLATLAFAHTLTDDDSGTRITHRLTISGPLTPLFARVIGRPAARELPDAMRALARLAERTAATPS